MPLSPLLTVATQFYSSFVLVFTGNNSTPLLYTPDFERENRLQEYYAIIEKKIAFFSLSEVEITKLKTATTDIEATSILGLATEALHSQSPEDIYKFCRAIEENHSEQLTYFKEWQNAAFSSLKIRETKEVLQLISGLAKDNTGEIASDDLTDIESCYTQIKASSHKDIFTQSWMLRLTMQILQPFKNHTLSYPALVQLAYLHGNKKTFNGLTSFNLEVLSNKKEYEELIEPFQNISIIDLSTADLSPLLSFGYDCMEAALKRVDDALRIIYRDKIDYSKKDARIRNLINFLYTQGVEYLAPLDSDLNERQQKIVKYLFTKRYLGTKELSLSFRCDRKTIQRDFTKLLNSEIVRSTGNGSALKYCINLKNNCYDMLEIHSTAVRRRDDFQESLFGEEIWETVKKAQ